MIYVTRRNRTKVKDILYVLQSYFDGLSLRNTAKVLSRFVHRNHTDAIRDGIRIDQRNYSILEKRLLNIF